MCLTWGVHASVVPDVKDVDEMVAVASNAALTEGFAFAGEEIVIVAGMPFGMHGSTNMVHVARVANSHHSTSNAATAPHNLVAREGVPA